MMEVEDRDISGEDREISIGGRRDVLINIKKKQQQGQRICLEENENENSLERYGILPSSADQPQTRSRLKEQLNAAGHDSREQGMRRIRSW